MSPKAKKLIRAALYVLALALVVLLLKDRLWRVLSASQRISELPVFAYSLMAVFELASFACIWWMFKLVLPGVSWRAIAKSQLISNASSRIIPGGAATGGAVQFRVLTNSGVSPAEAGGSLAATSILTFLGLFAIPATAGAVALVGAPLSGELLWGAIGGGLLLVGMLSVVFAITKIDGFLFHINSLIDWVGIRVSRMLSRSWDNNPTRLLDERDRILQSLEGKWIAVFAAAVGKWLFDFLVLLTAIVALDQDVNFALLLLAYAAASTLVMIPITPGGFGIVEVGLTSLLMTAGVEPDEADLSVFVYRLFSFWFPILVGAIALGINVKKESQS